MGKTKIKIVDDSKDIEERKSHSAKASRDKGKRASEKERAKSEPVKVIGTVEQSLPVIPSDSEESQDLKKQESRDSSASPQNDKKEKAQKPGKAKPRSKKYQEVAKDLDRSKTYPIPEAVDLIKKLSYSKFNATLEAHILTEQTGLRGFVSLPYASGKKLRILAFPPAKLTQQDKKELENGGIVFGDDSTIESISKGSVSFDLVISSPEWMSKLAKVAKVLGPKGLMPNPKNGTITDDLKKAVASYQAGKTEYKTEPKAPVIHLALGKLDQPNEELSQNIKILLQTIGKTKIKKVSLSPTMGPSVKIDLSTI